MPEDHRKSGYVTAALVFTLLTAVATPTVSAETLTAASVPHTSIQIAPDLRAAVDSMLVTSPTFREQYERLQRTPGLILAARLTTALRFESIRARSSVRRYASGLVVVVVEIGPMAPQIEMIAHEFEHVLEQLDGVDVRRRAERGQGAWFSASDMIETERAVRAGRVVADETHGRRGDKSVQAGQ